MSLTRDQLLQQAVKRHGPERAAREAAVDPGRVADWLSGETRTLQVFEMNALGRAVGFPIGQDDGQLAKSEAARSAGRGI